MRAPDGTEAMSTMRTASVFLAALLVVSSSAFAGEIFGKVFKDGAPVGEGAVAIEVQCGEQAAPAVKTDKSGSYHLVAPATGKCTMTVTHGPLSAALTVASYDEAVQIDLALEIQDGKLVVRRK
jgi:hypothetical protein